MGGNSEDTKCYKVSCRQLTSTVEYRAMPKVTERLLKVDGRSSGLLWDKARGVHAGIAGETLTVHPGTEGARDVLSEDWLQSITSREKVSWQDGVTCLNSEAFECKAELCKTRKVRRVNRLILNPDPRTCGNLLSLEKTLSAFQRRHKFLTASKFMGPLII